MLSDHFPLWVKFKVYSLKLPFFYTYLGLKYAKTVNFIVEISVYYTRENEKIK